jgi:hypothetical protein
VYSDIYQPIQSKIYEKDNVTTPQPPYGGSYREANTGSDTLKALAATLYGRSFVLPDYELLLAVCTDKNCIRKTYIRKTYRLLLRTGSTTTGLRTVVLST